MRLRPNPSNLRRIRGVFCVQTIRICNKAQDAEDSRITAAIANELERLCAVHETQLGDTISLLPSSSFNREP